jgi:polar amino acid transport system substrate-binding protein
VRRLKVSLSRLLTSGVDRGSRDPGSLPRGWWLAAALAVAVLAVVGIWLLLRTLPEAVDPTWERIQETGVLPVCTDPSWPPFEFMDEGSGQLEGFDIELAQLLASRLAPTADAGSGVQAQSGVRAQVVTVGFDSLYDALLSGRCDAVLSALPYEPMRTQDVAYSVAYFNAGLVLVIQEQTTDIEELDDLAGKVVGVEWGFVPEGDSRQRLFLQNLGARRYTTAEAALRALQTGEVEAVLVDRISALAYLRDCQGLYIAGEPITDLNYVIPLRPDSFRLLEEVNRALLEMREDGTLEGLRDRWF